jgi:hypothetical protein
MGRVSSVWFTRLKAFRNRNTLNPDLWFSQHRLACAIVSGEVPANFIPLRDAMAEARKEANARAAEEMMDRDAE